MSENVKTFILFDNQKEYIDLMSDEQAGKLVKALYAKNRGEDVTFSDPLVQMAFMMFWQAIENGRARREQLRENGSKGGRPKANPNQEKPNNNQNETKNNQDITKEEPNEKQSETDLDLNLNNINTCQTAGGFDGQKDENFSEQGELVPIDRHNALNCPQQKILDAYHEILPELPRVVKLDDDLQKNVRTRWQEKRKEKGFTSEEDGVAYFRTLFEYVARNKWLMGRADGSNGWTCNYRWLMQRKNFAKVTSGNYAGWQE